MGTLKEKLSRAFAVDPPGPQEPTEAQQPAVDWMCRQIARRHLTTPGLIMLEMSRPMNWVSAQMMHAFSPAVWAIARQQSWENYNHFAAFLERRGSMEYLMRRIEQLEKEYEQRTRCAQREPSASDDSPAGKPAR